MTGSPLDHLKAALSGRYEIERELGRGGMGVKLVVVMNWLDEVMPKLKGAKGP